MRKKRVEEKNGLNRFDLSHEKKIQAEVPTLDVNNVSNLVHLEIGGEVLHARLLEATREHVSRAATVSSWVSHSDF